MRRDEFADLFERRGGRGLDEVEPANDLVREPALGAGSVLHCGAPLFSIDRLECSDVPCLVLSGQSRFPEELAWNPEIFHHGRGIPAGKNGNHCHYRQANSQRISPVEPRNVPSMTQTEHENRLQILMPGFAPRQARPFSCLLGAPNTGIFPILQEREGEHYVPGIVCRADHAISKWRG